MASRGIRLLLIVCVLLPILWLCATARAYAEGNPPYSQELSAGPYHFLAKLSEYPPQVEHPLEITCVLHTPVPLSGQLVGRPGAGTDALEIHVSLSPERHTPTVLAGSLQFTVRGSWQVLFRFNGPRGPASASLDLVVAAPGAMPTWLGWLIGLSPLLGCLWFARRQYAYRALLLRHR
jgi:hypothetical protein